MSLTFPSPEWAAELQRQVSASAAYQKAAATWTFGAVALITRADPAIGLPEDIGLVLDIDRGTCRSVRVVGHNGRTTAGKQWVEVDPAKCS